MILSGYNPKQAHHLRLHVLAVGNVGSTLLLGLRLLAGETLSAIGIYDQAPLLCQRWEFEANQARPADLNQPCPKVRILHPEELFDCDIFVFCASRSVPSLGAEGDVRLLQYEANAALIGGYARQARQAGFAGLFAVVSDPVDLLCRAAYLAANENEEGVFDGRGLRPEQIEGFGLGVMHARAAYYAEKEERFRCYLREGRCFGPHGEGLVVADSLSHYNNENSLALTHLARDANLRAREMGFTPYAAPALSSGAYSLLAAIRGEWHYSAAAQGDIYWGELNRRTAAGIERESLNQPKALLSRIGESQSQLRAAQDRLDKEEAPWKRK